MNAIDSAIIRDLKDINQVLNDLLSIPAPADRSSKGDKVYLKRSVVRSMSTIISGSISHLEEQSKLVDLDARNVS